MIDQRVRLLTLRCIGYLIGRQRTMKCVHKWKKSSFKSPVIRLLVVVGLIVSIVTFSSQLFLFDNQETPISDDNSNLIAITTQLAANSLTADQNLYHRNPIKNILLYNPLPGRMGAILGAGKRFFTRTKNLGVL